MPSWGRKHCLTLPSWFWSPGWDVLGLGAGVQLANEIRGKADERELSKGEGTFSVMLLWVTTYPF